MGSGTAIGWCETAAPYTKLDGGARDDALRKRARRCAWPPHAAAALWQPCSRERGKDMGNRLQALNRHWCGTRPSLGQPRPLPTVLHQGPWATALRQLKAWVARAWERRPRAEHRPPLAAAACVATDQDAAWVDVEPMPLTNRTVRAFRSVLDRHPGARTAFRWLTVIENDLSSGRSDPIAGCSPWVLRQAIGQLEALVDLRREHDLVPLYLHMLRGAQRNGSPAAAAARSSSDLGVVQRYRAALRDILLSRSTEVGSLAIRLRDLRAGDRSGFAVWAEDQIDGFRLRVLSEAAGSPRTGARGAHAAGVNRAATATAELWLGIVLDSGDMNACAAAILLHEAASCSGPKANGAGCVRTR